jgi:predicted nuclease with TOPRIM domain
MCDRILKTLTGYNLNEFVNMGSSKNPPLSANQPLGDQENQTRAMQEDTSPHGRYQAEETDNVHIREEDAKMSSRRDTNLHKSSVKVRENASLKTQLEVKGRDLTQAFERAAELQRKVQRLTVEKDDFVRGKKDAENQARDIQGKNQKLEEELKMVKGTLRGIEEKYSHTAKLLDERTADLKAAQTFLTTVDRYAGAEILKMVEALNAEIFQGAALISELLGDGSTVDEQRKDVEWIQGAKDDLTLCIGPVLAEHLSTKSKEVQADPLPLQLAVQAILTNWCVFMVDSFYVGPAGDVLGEIYRRIRESGRYSCSKSDRMYVITDIYI